MTNFNDSRDNLEDQLSQFSRQFGFSAALRTFRTFLDTASFDQDSSEAQEFRTALHNLLRANEVEAQEFRTALHNLLRANEERTESNR